MTEQIRSARERAARVYNPLILLNFNNGPVRRLTRRQNQSTLWPVTSPFGSLAAAHSETTPAAASTARASMGFGPVLSSSVLVVGVVVVGPIVADILLIPAGQT